MIIPIRCFSCGKVIADKWRVYEERRHEPDILDKLGLTRICCRRHMLGHVDIIVD